jgi:transposase
MKTVLAGIDVASRTLAVALERPGRSSKQFELPNTPAGHRRLVRRLLVGKLPVRVCMEATGVYGFELAWTLHHSTGIEVEVANPRAVRDFARAWLQRSKTDAIDSQVLLEFVRRMPFEPWQPPALRILKIRALTRRIEALLRTRTREKNRLHMADRCPELSDLVRQDILQHIKQLDRSLRSLQQAALSLIREDRLLARRFDALQSVRGIAEASALNLLAELATLPPDMSPRQWVAHAGLDPRRFESGSSVSKPARISRIGNSHLRRALFFPAMVSARTEPHVRAYYQHLIARGKKPMQAQVAVMRKLLHAIHGMFSTQANFKGEKFYLIPS